jgi:hypothetical protein
VCIKTGFGDVTKADLGRSLQSCFLKCLLVRTLLTGELYILSLFPPAIYITALNNPVRILLLISCDVNILSSSENVIL